MAMIPMAVIPMAVSGSVPLDVVRHARELTALVGKLEVRLGIWNVGRGRVFSRVSEGVCAAEGGSLLGGLLFSLHSLFFRGLHWRTKKTGA